MKIFKKVTKTEEIDELIGYACDICKNKIEIEEWERPSSISYTEPAGGWRGSEITEKHICSRECLLKAIQYAQRDTFSCNIYLNEKLFKEYKENEED